MYIIKDKNYILGITNVMISFNVALSECYNNLITLFIFTSKKHSFDILAHISSRLFPIEDDLPYTEVL